MALERKSVVPGVVVMIFGLLLFMVAVSDTLSFPPTKVMHYVIIVFTLLGINFGISSGKKLAYGVHDKNIILKDTQGKGNVSSAAASVMRTSVAFAFLTILLWSLFVITLSFFWNALSDTLFFGQVRWFMILSMVILICGSYLFYKAKSSTVNSMLTFTGKKMKQGTSVGKKTLKVMDNAENMGKSVMERTVNKLLQKKP
ncbi:MAG TPA: hypothetical protein ENI45_01990 [Thermoplasmatales archaeon]|nr:hypothetical protein [Thermoplasmatales archaeon]